MVTAFNSYTVYNADGGLIAHDRETRSTPETYFEQLSRDIKGRAHLMLVLQEHGNVAMYMVTQPSAPAPMLGRRTTLTPRGCGHYDSRPLPVGEEEW